MDATLTSVQVNFFLFPGLPFHQQLHLDKVGLSGAFLVRQNESTDPCVPHGTPDCLTETESGKRSATCRGNTRLGRMIKKLR